MLKLMISDGKCRKCFKCEDHLPGLRELVNGGVAELNAINGNIDWDAISEAMKSCKTGALELVPVRYRYGNSSRRRLDTCSDAVQRVMNRAINYVNISILCGRRNKEDQERAFREGKSQVHWPNSAHNVDPDNEFGKSDAVDCGIWRDDLGNVDFDDPSAFGLLAGVIHACAEDENCVAIWGHDWDSDFNFKEHGFVDLPHFTILTREDYLRKKHRG